MTCQGHKQPHHTPPQLSLPELQTIHLPEFNVTRLTDLASGSGSTTGEEGEVNPPPIVQETAWAPAKLITHLGLDAEMSGATEGQGKGPGPPRRQVRRAAKTP